MEIFKQTIILLFWFIMIVIVLQRLINKIDFKKNIINLKDNDIIHIHKRAFKYNEFYKRLEAIDKHSPEIACSKCNNVSFQLQYRNYEIIAHCTCGHSMTVYDG